MIKVKNQTTGQVSEVWYVDVKNGVIVANSKKPRAKFYERNGEFIVSANIYTEEGFPVFVVRNGYELTNEKASRRPKEAEPVPAEDAPVEDVPETTPEAPVEMEEIVDEADVTEVPVEAPVETPKAPAQAAVEAPKTDGLNDALSAAFAPIFANVAKTIEANIRAEVQVELDALKAQAKSQATRIELVKPDGETHEVEGLFCEEFEDMCNDVNNGWSPYLWGASGCGKSHTCKQIADALGLPYYTQNMLQFAHEIAGYGNAAGEFVPTAFFQAFSEGGLFHLDEADRSAIEGLVTLNQALEQKVFNFPVVGNVTAHPNFRFICSGNTQMNGADEMYTSGPQQDASFKRRVIFYEMSYDRRIELPIMAQGDEVLVNFVEDVRRAIKKTGTLHFVSYTETRYMKQHENKKEKALIRSTFKSLDTDIIRQIYRALDDTDNPWARAMYNVTNGLY